MNMVLAALVVIASAITPLGFRAETKVLLADGSHLAISQVRVGDQLRSTDPGTARDTTSRVTKTTVHDGQAEVVDIATTAGSVVTTGDTRFWVAEREDWVEAGGLRVGHRLLDVDGSRVTITAVRVGTKRVVAHHLTVEDVPACYLAVGGRHVLAQLSAGPAPGPEQAKNVSAHRRPGSPPLSRRTPEPPAG